MPDYIMQARSGGESGDGLLYSWRSNLTPDFSASGFPGPGNAADISVLTTFANDATITPSQITANQNNYAPTKWDPATGARLSTDAARTITGLEAPLLPTRRRKTVTNVGAFDIVFAHQSGSSSAANRIIVPGGANLTLKPDFSIELIYDPTSQRWRLENSGSGGGMNIQYAASAAITIGLATGPLASDTNLLAGRSSATIDNNADLSVDKIISGTIQTGTTPTTGKSIEVWLIPALDDTPTWPDTFDGTDKNVTATTRALLQAYGIPLIVFTTDGTTNQKYQFERSLASVFGGVIPKKFQIFVVHNTGVALRNTGQTITQIGIKYV